MTEQDTPPTGQHADLSALQELLRHAPLPWNAGVATAAFNGLARAIDSPADEHHTMDELYDYRMLYNALAFNSWASHRTHPVVKSWTHSDGEPCFGGGWFIVVAVLPTGLVSNHYRAEHWDLFHVREDTPPEHDGHTPEIAAERMRQLLRADIPDHAVDNASRPWDTTDDAGYEHPYASGGPTGERPALIGGASTSYRLTAAAAARMGLYVDPVHDKLRGAQPLTDTTPALAEDGEVDPTDDCD